MKLYLGRSKIYDYEISPYNKEAFREEEGFSGVLKDVSIKYINLPEMEVGEVFEIESIDVKLRGKSDETS